MRKKPQQFEPEVKIAENCGTMTTKLPTKADLPIAEQINWPQVGRVVPVMNEQGNKVADLKYPDPKDLTPGYTMLLQALKDLRLCRDSKLFLRDGSHTFREWCMKQFGERLGGWLEEML